MQALELFFPSVSSIISVTVLGAALGIILSIAKIKLNVEKDKRYGYIVDALPGANCGACGFPGCGGYAMKIIEGSVPINLCMVGGKEAVEKISRIMEIQAEVRKPVKARVHCHGGSDVAAVKYLYNGPRTCVAANQVMGGFKVCQYGCLGLGDCENSCPFDAIHLDERGVPVVDWERCTGCGACVTACPRGIITLEDAEIEVHVACRNLEKAPVMKKGCSVGCIACNRCVKACKEVFADKPEIGTAIEVVNFCAVIDYTKCINCGKCAEVCPNKVIDLQRVLVVAG